MKKKRIQVRILSIFDHKTQKISGRWSFDSIQFKYLIDKNFLIYHFMHSNIGILKFIY